ncbi:glucose-6-phosphate dehydrogenase assembly protein OpcA [Phytomonospora endophytica]|uniref:Glucose-6-phosphate dehydrogenase assembly protein OpcA n=1 Tax=Phytomonospora endophytica TaxID=714109 RepID=A0A841FSW7_9ACTN|nr:glucose-6-phosphate dehydrogenase assembly protein OpcA [Phytomonospora endophytica]MBB6035619.1 glucose-6-phosphate dehydrogenase assembly protein OpcA [Phytomonospora endophytica]GIG70017.1 glucose-6-phosphate dehydrogenase assembly protein OpcA [Phytomonospora endophytica]
MIALWDTTATEVVKALASERHSSGGLTSGLALNLVVIVDEKGEREAEAALTHAAQQHPCRLLIVVRRDSDQTAPRLDAEIVVGGRLGPCEAVVMRVYGPLVEHAESVVMPLLAPDVPVVTCWFVSPPVHTSADPLGAFADRRITYSARSADPIASLRGRAEDYSAGDTDISWTRITYWRSLIASAFDTASAPAASVTITAKQTDPSAVLMSGWLGGRLGVTPTIDDTDVVRDSEHLPAIKAVTITLENGHEIAITRDEGGNTLLRRTGFPDRTQTIKGRTLGELLAEELRHLDPDQPYEAALGQCTGHLELCRDAEAASA